MNADWDLLTVSANTRTMRQSEDGVTLTDTTRDEVTRLRLLTDGQLRTAIAHGPANDLDDLLHEAAATTGLRGPGAARLVEATPAARAGLSNTLRREDLASLPWLSQLGTDHLDVRLRIQRPGDQHATQRLTEDWKVLGLQRHPLARVPTDAGTQHGCVPSPDPRCWLLPPWVVSQLMLGPLLSVLTSDEDADAATWDAVDIYDPAWGGGVDMNGTPRQPTLFISSGDRVAQPIGAPLLRRKATACTGHAGLASSMIRDLVIAGRGATTASLPAAARIVVDAARLTGGTSTRNIVVGLRVGDHEDDDGGTYILTLPDLCRLLRDGWWCGPWQRGIGPWTSQWLAIGEPETWL